MTSELCPGSYSIFQSIAITYRQSTNVSTQVMGVKRSHEAMEAQSPSPLMPMFEQFRAELDEHHDRRERITKASRDITAASKKM